MVIPIVLVNVCYLSLIKVYYNYSYMIIDAGTEVDVHHVSVSLHCGREGSLTCNSRGFSSFLVVHS